MNNDFARSDELLRQSEERYFRMIDEVEDYAILLLDRNGNIQNWNKGAEKIKGYKENEILGKNFRIFYTKEDQDNGLPELLIDKAVKQGKALHEGWRVRKDGTRFWGSIVITALHDDQKNVIGFSKVTRDLTERKETEDRYHKMIDEVEDYAIIFLDRNGNIQNWNKGAEKIKGYTESDIIGKNFRIFYSREDQEKNYRNR
jgi:PAS domain S-box-containing protein